MLYILLPLSFVWRARPRLAGRGADLQAVRESCVLQPVEYDEPVTDDQGKPVWTTRPAQDQEAKLTEQVIAVGPAASQVAIKQLGHQRRRLLQRQFRPSLREPHAALELPRDAVDPADLRGALLHVRRDGRRHAAGLGDPGRHAGHLRACSWPSASRPSSAATPLAYARRRPGRQRPAGRRQHGGQGDHVSASPTRRSGPRPRRPPPTAR